MYDAKTLLSMSPKEVADHLAPLRDAEGYAVAEKLLIETWARTGLGEDPCHNYCHKMWCYSCNDGRGEEWIMEALNELGFYAHRADEDTMDYVWRYEEGMPR